jgi:nucleotide-binding universal stress UspA family protein
MYKNILVPLALDHERDVSAALGAARALASEGATITALTVIEAVPAYILAELPEGQSEHNKEAALEALKEEIGGAGDINAVAVTGHSARTILDYAESHGADCIIIASHRPGLQDYFLGSTASRVVRHANCAVHVIR